MKKTVVATLGILFLSQMSFAAIPCSVGQVVSSSPGTSQKIIGNAFAISGTELLVNDHSLGADRNSIHVLIPGTKNSIPAVVLIRDFYRDLAILKISSSQLQRCAISTGKLSSQSRVDILSLQEDEQNPTSIPAAVLDVKSTRLQIPGIESGIELTAQGMNLLEGRSGGVLLENSQVVGMLAQRTDEGSVLAIPGAELIQFLTMVGSGKPPAYPFQVNSEKSEVMFNGLSIKFPVITQDVIIAGHGHDGLRQNFSGNPHGGLRNDSNKDRVYAISRSETKSDFAVAQIEDFSQLAAYDQMLENFLKSAGAKEVFIISVDNRAVSNNLELIRELGRCKTCKITSVLIKSKEAQNINKAENNIDALAMQLLAKLRSDQFLNKKFVDQCIDELEQFRIANAVSAINASGLQNPADLTKVKAQWDKAEEQFGKQFLPEEMMDLIEKIRALVLKI